MNRTEILKNEVKNNSEDPFNYYLLALEYQKIENTAEAKKYFQILVKNFDEYLATYYTYANFLILLDQEQEALEIIMKGIAISQKQKNSKAEKELKQMLELHF
jgi:tetratricopeptide (TPR) repeat protein